MIRLIVVGKMKEKAMVSLVAEYQKRIGAFIKVEIVEVSDEMAPQSYSIQEMERVKEKEGQRILAKLKDQEFVILLDLAGKMMTSEKLAEQIHHVQTYQTSTIAFVIGGSLGLSEEVIQRANLRWKLSDLTFPHQLVRVLVMEQVYRAFTILHHLPYHK